jgi:hypothetical protein
MLYCCIREMRLAIARDNGESKQQQPSRWWQDGDAA